MLNATHNAPGHSVRRVTAADAPRLARLCEAHAACEKLPFNPQGHAV